MNVIVTVGEGDNRIYAAFSDAPDLESPRTYIERHVVGDLKITVEAHEPTAQEIQDYPYSIEPWNQHDRI